MTSDRGIGVVGAGPAGLAAAWRLASGGHGVTVYESGHVGGRLRTEVVAGSGADAAVQLLSAGYRSLVDLAQAVGAGGLLVRVPGRDALWRGGRAHSLRYGSVTSMASSGALPSLLKVRLGLKYVPFLERNAEALDLNDPGLAVAAGLDDETIADWGRREMGEDFVELLAYPLLASYYGVTPEETSAGVFHALARAGLRVRLLGVRGGVGALGDAIAGWLEERGVVIQRDTRVSGVEAGDRGVRLRLATGAMDHHTADHDAVVVAVPVAEANRLVPGMDWLGGVRSRSTAALVLGLSRPVETGWFGLCIPRAESTGAKVAAVCVQGEKETDVVGAGSGSLVVIPTPAAGEDWSEGEPRLALQSALPVLDEVLPGIRGDILEARLVRLGEATFVPAPGHFGRVRQLETSALPGRVALAGDYLVAPTVEGAVRSGLRAADRLMAGAG
jgi:protoporphyrinogen/coproporphyrinogen III oxidase